MQELAASSISEQHIDIQHHKPWPERFPSWIDPSLEFIFDGLEVVKREPKARLWVLVCVSELIDF